MIIYYSPPKYSKGLRITAPSSFPVHMCHFDLTTGKGAGRTGQKCHPPSTAWHCRYSRCCRHPYAADAARRSPSLIFVYFPSLLALCTPCPKPTQSNDSSTMVVLRFAPPSREKKGCTLNPSRTAVPFWVETSWNLTDLSPKRDCSTKRVEA